VRNGISGDFWANVFHDHQSLAATKRYIWREPPAGRNIGQAAGAREVRRRELILLLGGVILPSRALYAQAKPMPVIGYLPTGRHTPSNALMAAFRQGLSERGYVEGQNVVIEFRPAQSQYDRLPTLAAELVDHKVDVIAAFSIPAALAAKNATSTIPIVFSIGADPIEFGLVASLARPGGNLTGVSALLVDLTAKRLDLLSQLVPEAKGTALLLNPNNPNSERVIRDVQEAARAKGCNLLILKAGTESEIDATFASFDRLQAGGLVVSSDPFFDSQREQLVTLAARYAIPAIYEWREFATAGGLISYGPSLKALYRQVGNYAGKILNGAKPTDLPVEQPTKFELVVNLKTAKTLGLTVPLSVLGGADEVIE